MGRTYNLRTLFTEEKVEKTEEVLKEMLNAIERIKNGEAISVAMAEEDLDYKMTRLLFIKIAEGKYDIDRENYTREEIDRIEDTITEDPRVKIARYVLGCSYNNYKINFNENEVCKVVDKMLDELTDSERKIIDLSYGISNNGSSYNFREIAEILGVSNVRIGQLQRRAFYKMRRQAKLLCYCMIDFDTLQKMRSGNYWLKDLSSRDFVKDILHKRYRVKKDYQLEYNYSDIWGNGDYNQLANVLMDFVPDSEEKDLTAMVYGLFPYQHRIPIYSAVEAINSKKNNTYYNRFTAEQAIENTKRKIAKIISDSTFEVEAFYASKLAKYEIE